MPALLAGAPGIVVPEIEHGLAEMLDDVATVEIDVLDQRAAIIAIKNDVLVFAGRPAAFHYDADRIRGTDRGVRDIRRDEEGFPLADEMIDDPVAFADADFDVAFQLVEKFLRVDLVKIIPQERWILYSHQIIHHGRALCVARNPRCVDCLLEPICYAKDKTI